MPSASAPKEVRLQIEPAELSAWRAAGSPLQILDVREPWEVALCGLSGAVNLPLGQLPGRFGELDRGRPLVVLCHHGARSMQAVKWLRAQGYDQAINLAGGIDAWARTVEPGMATY